MPSYRVSVKKIEKPATDALALTLKKPQGFQFRAGQYILLRLDNVVEKKPHAFSIASAPHEEDILLITRMSPSPFKQAMQQLTPSSEVTIEGPYGTLALHSEKNRPAVFLAGGIGITPLMSIIRDQKKNHFPIPIHLFYFNRSRDSTVYLDEFLSLEHKNFSLTPVFEIPPPDWKGETGILTENLLKKYIPDIHLPIYYIVGPPKMVEAVYRTLERMGVDKTQIRIERFT